MKISIPVYFYKKTFHNVLWEKALRKEAIGLYSKNILTLLNLDYKEITVSDEIIENESDFIIVGETNPEHDRYCPECGVRGEVKEKIQLLQKLSIAKFHQKNLNILITKRRFKCKNCNISWTQSLPYIEKHREITNDAYLAIYDDCKKIISFSDIAREHNVSVTTVINVFDKMCFEKPLTLRICICVDEFYFKVTKYNKFPVVISDAKSGRILDIIHSRKKAYLDEYFSKKNLIERETVKFFSCDLNDSYRKCAHKRLPNAIVIADFFHVTKLLTTILDKKRIRFMNQVEKNSFEYKFLKSNWRYFLMSNKRLLQSNKIIKDDNGQDRFISDYIFSVVKKNEEFLEMYLIYRDYGWLMSEKKGTDKNIITRNLEFLINKCLASIHSDVVTLGNTLLDRSVEIINAYSEENKYNISNGIAECNNNRIEKLIEVGNGYRNLNRLKKRVLLIEKTRTK